MAKSVLMAELGQLVSEARNPATMQIDLMSTPQILAAMNDEDAQVAGAVQQVLPAIGAAVDKIVEAFKAGGRLVYIGAGTSGRRLRARRRSRSETSGSTLFVAMSSVAARPCT